MKKSAFLAAVEQARRDLRHGKRPTDLHLRVAEWLDRQGSAELTAYDINGLAVLCNCDSTTIRKTIARLRALGLLDLLP